MPIIDLQRRIREAGRIRTGETVSGTRNGKAYTRPAKLETFRLTSANRADVEAAASAYGGEVREWADAPGGTQWQVTTEAKALEVIVPPADVAFSQWYELWSGGGCERRCDGRYDVVRDAPCACDATARECNYVTRLSVLLVALTGIGVWRLESHGYYAATELGGMVDLLNAAAERGTLIPAELRLEQREVKRRDAKGNPITYKFAVPVLDPRLSVVALLTGNGIVPERAINAGTSAATTVVTTTPPFTPVPNEAPEVGVGEAVAAVEQPKPKLPRINAQEAIKPTGKRPRKVAEVAREAGSAGDAEPTAPEAPGGGAGSPPGDLNAHRLQLKARLAALPPPVAEQVKREWPTLGLPDTLNKAIGWNTTNLAQCERFVVAAETKAADVRNAAVQRCAILCRELGWSDEQRHAWVAEQTGGLAGLTECDYLTLASLEAVLEGLLSDTQRELSL